MVLEQIIKMVATSWELTMALEETFSLPDTPEDEPTNIHTVGDLAITCPAQRRISA